MKCRFLLFAAFGVGAVACKKHVVEVSTTAYIIGPSNDIRSASPQESEIGEKPLNAAVLVATRLADKRVKFCSGTLVLPEVGKGGLRVLTNHHCFAQPGADGKATRDLLLEACSFTTVYFGYLAGQAKDAVPITCEAGTLRTNFEGDLAVFTLAQNPPDKYQPLALWEGEEAPASDTFFIHAMGGHESPSMEQLTRCGHNGVPAKRTQMQNMIQDVKINNFMLI